MMMTDTGPYAWAPRGDPNSPLLQRQALASQMKTASTLPVPGPSSALPTKLPTSAGPSPAGAGKADTNGYATPGYQAAKPGGVLPGWDATKWADTTHQSPKYVVGRILSQYAPTVSNLGQAISQIMKAYPGASFNGKDTVDIPGVGPIDVLQGAGEGGKAWQWLDKNAGGGGGGPAAGPIGSAVSLMGSMFNPPAPSSSDLFSRLTDVGGSGYIQQLLQQIMQDQNDPNRAFATVKV